MKKVFLTSCIFFLIGYTFSSYSQPKLFIYLVSHNEDKIGYLNTQGGYNRYIQARSALKNLGDLVIQKKIAYNYGADYVALQAIAQYDVGSLTSSTNNKNLVKWMKEDCGIECDPHAHESAYNYADVAYLMSQLGITPTNTMSGFLYDDTLQNGNSWEDYQNGVTGDSFPNFTWYPEILWGAATLMHVNDPLYFGVYKPKSMVEFNVHEPNNHLILCGTGCELKLEDTATVAYKLYQIKRVINAIQNGTLPSNGIYTQEIFFSEGDVAQPWFFPLVDALTDSINALVSLGQVEWKNISAIVDYWKTSYSEEPFASDCDFNVIISSSTTNSNTEIIQHTDDENNLQLWPNPGNGLIHFKNNFGSIVIYDQIGNQILQKEISDSPDFDCSFLSNGIYFIRTAEEVQKYILIH